MSLLLWTYAAGPRRATSRALGLLAVLSTLLLCASVNTAAQSTGRVSGRVLDQTGAALRGVAVDLVVSSRELTATTDDTGAYHFDAVPAGDAEFTFRLLNFSVLRRSARVDGAAVVTANVVLTLSLSADVIVTATGTFRNVADVENPAANLVGIAAAASQGAVTAAQIAARPVMRAGEVLEAVPGLIVRRTRKFRRRISALERCLLVACHRLPPPQQPEPVLNFTYFLDDPDNGDQFEQAERRLAAGGRVTYRRLGHLFDRHTESAIGVQLRRDWLDPVGLYRTASRQRLSTTREDEVDRSDDDDERPHGDRRGS